MFYKLPLILIVNRSIRSVNKRLMNNQWFASLPFLIHQYFFIYLHLFPPGRDKTLQRLKTVIIFTRLRLQNSLLTRTDTNTRARARHPRQPPSAPSLSYAKEGRLLQLYTALWGDRGTDEKKGRPWRSDTDRKSSHLLPKSTLIFFLQPERRRKKGDEKEQGARGNGWEDGSVLHRAVRDRWCKQKDRDPQQRNACWNLYSTLFF